MNALKALVGLSMSVVCFVTMVEISAVVAVLALPVVGVMVGVSLVEECGLPLPGVEGILREWLRGLWGLIGLTADLAYEIVYFKREVRFK